MHFDNKLVFDEEPILIHKEEKELFHYNRFFPTYIIFSKTPTSTFSTNDIGSSHLCPWFVLYVLINYKSWFAQSTLVKFLEPISKYKINLINITIYIYIFLLIEYSSIFIAYKVWMMMIFISVVTTFSESSMITFVNFSFL